MIALISGNLIHLDNTFVIVDVDGVGYKIFVPQRALSSFTTSEQVTLWTHTAVKETSLELYGFLSREELLFFELLISVSGIGPKSGLAIIDIAPVTTLASAVASEDTSYLTKVSGIGKKSAQKIVLELKDKLEAHPELTTEESFKADEDALDALVALGYSQHQSREALRTLGETVEGTSNRIKEALKLLGS